MIKQIARLLLSAAPRHYQTAAQACRILSDKQGHLKSARQQSCVDKADRPIPWYTYPAIDFITQLDWQQKIVFEYGSGNSTLFWSTLAKRVVSVESDPTWHGRVEPQLPAHAAVMLRSEREAYCRFIEQFGMQFDVIIVDGNWRFDCARISRDFLKPGGVIILDNSDWHPKASEFLRSSGLLEVDMTGFGPINAYTWTTSFYFSRDFSGQPLRGRQPMPGIGSIDQFVDEEPLLILD